MIWHVLYSSGCTSTGKALVNAEAVELAETLIFECSPNSPSISITRQTRSLVQKLLMPVFEQDSLSRKNLSIYAVHTSKCRHSIVGHYIFNPCCHGDCHVTLIQAGMLHVQHIFMSVVTVDNIHKYT